MPLSLKAIIMVLTAASGAYATSAAVLPYLSNAQGNGYFILTVYPSSLAIPQGASSSSTVTVGSRNGFTGTVTLSISFLDQDLPATLQDNSLSLSVAGTASTTLTVSPSSDAPLGDYGIIVTGRGIGHKRTLSSSALLSVEVTSTTSSTATFHIEADPSTVDNLAGSSNTVQIILTSLNNYEGTVTLTATVPFGFIEVMGGPDPVTLVPNGTASTTLQITTTSETEPGSYEVVVTGTNEVESNSVAITVNVTTPVIESLTLTSYNFASSTNLTLYLQNTGDVQIKLVSYIVRDANGNAWVLSNWNGPSINPASIASASILIWTSCSGCYYTGILGMFNEFVAGRTYSLVLAAESGSQFTFTVTR